MNERDRAKNETFYYKLLLNKTDLSSDLLLDMEINIERQLSTLDLDIKELKNKLEHLEEAKTYYNYIMEDLKNKHIGE